jgi:CDGSH-type Zn-finger protein
MENKKAKIKIVKDGPLVVSGCVPLAKEIIVSDENGDSAGFERKPQLECTDSYSLCRCGKSANKPFCDGTHARIKFDGTETAEKTVYAKRSETVSGPGMDLDDLPELCARARFCHDQKGDIWNNAQDSDDPRLKKEAVRQACLCPSGRLVAHEKNGPVIEPKLEQGIGLIEDPQKRVSGPVWVKGGIEIEGADGQKYETRNRATLCRCGKSQNKPFCNGCHIDEKFNDGDPSLKQR